MIPNMLYQFNCDSIVATKNLQKLKLMRINHFFVLFLMSIGARQSSFKKICSTDICSKCAKLYVNVRSSTIRKIWWVSKFIPKILLKIEQFLDKISEKNLKPTIQWPNTTYPAML